MRGAKIGYCFPYCFLKIFLGGQGFDGRAQSCDRGIPQSPLEKIMQGVHKHFFGRDAYPRANLKYPKNGMTQNSNPKKEQPKIHIGL